MVKRNTKPAWLIPKKVGKLKPMSTRNVVKRHLKEWNFDDDEEYGKTLPEKSIATRIAERKASREGKNYFEPDEDE